MNARTDIDGVPTIVHSGRDGVLHAQLTFGVGMVDEPLPLRGVTHVIEHLTMHSARDTPAEINADVDLETTNFYASGTPERVVRFLHDVCTALTDLPLDRLEVEKGVLEAEGGAGCHPIVAAVLTRRFGGTYAGSLFFTGAATAALTATQVRDFARRWYVAGNAVLHITGRVPEGLELSLPQGTPPDHGRPRGHLGPRPVMVTMDDPPVAGAGVALRLPPDDASHHRSHTIDILQGRIEDECRHLAGHAYTVAVELITAPDGVEAVIHTDARDGKETAVAQAVVDAVHDLAANGPSPEEVARSVEALQEAWDVGGAEVLVATNEEMYRFLGQPHQCHLTSTLPHTLTRPTSRLGSQTRWPPPSSTSIRRLSAHWTTDLSWCRCARR